MREITIEISDDLDAEIRRAVGDGSLDAWAAEAIAEKVARTLQTRSRSVLEEHGRGLEERVDRASD